MSTATLERPAETLGQLYEHRGRLRERLAWAWAMRQERWLIREIENDLRTVWNRIESSERSHAKADTPAHTA